MWFYTRFRFVPGARPWPLFNSAALLCFLGGFIGRWHKYNCYPLLLGLLSLLLGAVVWVLNVRKERLIDNRNTEDYFNGLRFGILMFILSEVLFFFSFFWGQYDMHWVPGMEPLTMGGAGVPVINTFLLLSSGVAITWVHENIYEHGHMSFSGLGITILLGGIFFFAQCLEYSDLPLGFCDGPVFSRFFLITGFHGSHVVIGLTLLIMTYIHAWKSGIRTDNHTGFEGAAWYWHFVDVVWLFLYVRIYDPRVSVSIALLKS